MEPVNGWLHFSGAVLAAAGLALLVATAAERDSARHVIGATVFGVSALTMFGASALYHLAHHSPRRRLYRQLDHAMIYVFIAGTYTPICLIALWGTGLGAPMLVAVWILAALGVLQKVKWPDAPRGLSTGLYLGLGWLGTLAARPLLATAPPETFAWILTGGLLYTVGAIVYWAKWPRGVPGRFGFHELWHVFVLAASASHFWAVLRYVLPLA
jgi:hemolysin III